MTRNVLSYAEKLIDEPPRQSKSRKIPNICAGAKCSVMQSEINPDPCPGRFATYA